MSNIAIFKTGQPPQYLKSVNTPDYSSDPDVLVNPDIAAVQAIPTKYWKRVGDTVQEMITSEKTALDAAEKQKIKDALTLNNIPDGFLATALVELGIVKEKDLLDKIKEKI